MSKDLYLQQKLGENRDRRYTTIIDIDKITFSDDRRTVIIGKDNKYYTYWHNTKYGGFEKQLAKGMKVAVYVNQKSNPKGKHPYCNITPDIFNLSNQNL